MCGTHSVKGRTTLLDLDLPLLLHGVSRERGRGGEQFHVWPGDWSGLLTPSLRRRVCVCVHVVHIRVREKKN